MAASSVRRQLDQIRLAATADRLIGAATAAAAAAAAVRWPAPTRPVRLSSRVCLLALGALDEPPLIMPANEINGRACGAPIGSSSTPAGHQVAELARRERATQKR
jgi:hypothetical protein